MHKLVIFDLDGVLIEACDWHKEAFNESLKQVSDICLTEEEHVSEFNGLPTKTKLQKLVDTGKIKSSDVEQIQNLKQHITIDLIEQKSKVLSDKIELLEYIKSRNIKIACCTNSIKKTAYLMLEKAGIIKYFNLILTNEDVSLPKPSPEGYNKCIKYFSVDKKDVLIVEDSPVGIKAAESSGADVVKVRNQDEVNLNLLRSLI